MVLKDSHPSGATENLTISIGFFKSHGLEPPRVLSERGDRAGHEALLGTGTLELEQESARKHHRERTWGRIVQVKGIACAKRRRPGKSQHTLHTSSLVWLRDQ